MREIVKLAQGVEREGMSIVPMKIYFNEQGRAKIEIALGRGKKLHDKRETEKKRDWNPREIAGHEGAELDDPVFRTLPWMPRRWQPLYLANMSCFCIALRRFFICVLMFMVTWGMAVSERNIAGYAHTKAQIERVWTECTKSCYKVGEIVFQREQDGRSIACRAQVRPGSRVEGEVIDIALEPNSCYGPTILGGPLHLVHAFDDSIWCQCRRRLRTYVCRIPASFRAGQNNQA